MHDVVLGGLPRAEEECRKADLYLCMGSSLTVCPANDLPTYATSIVICNPQVTNLDKQAALRVWATSDLFMSLLMKTLQERPGNVHDDDAAASAVGVAVESNVKGKASREGKKRAARQKKSR